MKNFWQKLAKPILALAPMAGVTDIAFRQMCKRFGADVIFTEFVSTDALVYKSKKTMAMIKFDDQERPVVVQIFGKDPETFSHAGKILETTGCDGIDINFGCPAYKVVRHGGGVNLMKNPQLCAELVQAITESVKIPVSIKIRSSIKKDASTKKIKRTSSALPADIIDPSDHGSNQDLDKITALDLVNAIKHLPVASLMIHARSYERPFDGEPNIAIVKQIRQVWDKILIYNGGVYTPEIAKQMLDETQADGVGIARGAWGKPWLFKQIKEYLRTGKYNEPSYNEIKKYILEHAELARQAKGEHGLIELRKHLAWYVKGWPGAKKIRDSLVRSSSIKEINEILK